jgi:hypothetical protein
VDDAALIRALRTARSLARLDVFDEAAAEHPFGSPTP